MPVYKRTCLIQTNAEVFWTATVKTNRVPESAEAITLINVQLNFGISVHRGN